MKYKTLNNNVVVCILCLIVLCFEFGCLKFEVDSQKPQFEEKLKVVIPNGNELRIEVEKSKTNKIVVRVTNISDSDIFCSYLPQINSEKAAYFPYTIEKRNSGSEGFKIYIGNGHFAPGLHPIAAGETIEYSNTLLDKGDYRVKIRYLVDKSVRELINEKVPEPGLSDSERERVSLAYIEAISSVISVSKSF